MPPPPKKEKVGEGDYMRRNPKWALHLHILYRCYLEKLMVAFLTGTLDATVWTPVSCRAGADGAVDCAAGLF